MEINLNKLKWIGLVFLFFVLLGLGKVAYLYTEWLWFEEVGFTNVFWITLLTRIKLYFAFCLLFFLVFYGNILIAQRLAPKYIEANNETILLGYPAIKPYVNAFLLVVALFFSLTFGGIASEWWIYYLRYANQAAFSVKDPIFNKDIAFYVFTLPFLKVFWGWLLSSLILTTITTLFVHWLSGGIRIRRRIQRFAPYVKAHLSILCGLILLLIAFGFFLSIYGLLYSPRGVAFGAGFTDIHAQLPAYQIMIFISLVCAVLFLINIHYQGWRLPLTGISLLLTAWFVVGVIYPAIIQQYKVSPNELFKERAYIKLNIAYTRKAYNLNQIQENKFASTGKLSLEEINKNVETISNIRLWDWRPLKTTFAQIQGIRPYYAFNDVDIDRYQIDGNYRAVTLAARELLTDRLREQAKTWVNQHLIYTHGYGVVLNSVSVVNPGGLPELLIKDIPPKSSTNLKVTQPGLYFAEVANDYVIVKTKEKEFDYPKGDENEYTIYQGEGGIPISSSLRKLAFAWRFNSLKLLLSDAVTAESRVLFHRKITERINNIAPFLSYDSDPYIVLSQGKLYWMVDAYTLTNMYPYSEPFDGKNNYIRNSVKVVIDAYNGDVTFYAFDETDPLLKTYANIFPNLFKSFEEMPADLKVHIRYPEGLFKVQAQMYATYHMQDPQVFYGKEDMWSIPEEIYEDSRQPVEAYYIIMKLPGESKEEFILMLPLTPAGKDNMISWLCARCDLPNYGKLLTYKFPKDKLVYGPMQIEARIDQDAHISQQFTLWGQVGSRIIRGNLLVIPIEESILYVEPIYLQAEQTGLPEFKRVIVAFEDKIVMEENLETALTRIFKLEVGVKPEEELTTQKLIEAAVEYYDKAQEYLRTGNWSLYGKEMKKLEETLKKLESRIEK